MLITETIGQKYLSFSEKKELKVRETRPDKQIKEDSVGELKCLKLTLNFLAEEQEINAYLIERLNTLTQGKSKQIDIIGISLLVDSYHHSRGRYLPVATTLLVNYRISQIDKKSPTLTWKIERFLGEEDSISLQGSHKYHQKGVNKSWQDWMQNVSRAKPPGKWVFSNYCSIEGNPGIFLAIGLCTYSEKLTQIPHNCYGCRYFYGEEHNDNFVVCHFHDRGKKNCQRFQPQPFDSKKSKKFLLF